MSISGALGGLVMLLLLFVALIICSIDALLHSGRFTRLRALLLFLSYPAAYIGLVASDLTLRSAGVALPPPIETALFVVLPSAFVSLAFWWFLRSRRVAITMLLSGALAGAFYGVSESWCSEYDYFCMMTLGPLGLVLWQLFPILALCKFKKACKLARRNQCPQCDYSTEGLPAPTCPECGANLHPPGAAAES